MRTGNRVGDSLRRVGEFLEDRWFDRTRRVRTSWDVSLTDAGIADGEQRDSEGYQPARPRHIRQALREMPVADVRGYSYVDLGSGKGRTLFVAAEMPFRQVIGVEFSPLLHGLAEANLLRFRGDAAAQVVAMHGDAARFIFPEGPLVLYLFNPFGAATMARVMGRLAESLARAPRHVVVLLLWPQCAAEVMAVPGMRMVRERQEYRIYEVGGV